MYKKYKNIYSSSSSSSTYTPALMFENLKHLYQMTKENGGVHVFCSIEQLLTYTVVHPLRWRLKFWKFCTR